MQLRQCLDPYPVASVDQGETYSYLCVDPQWDTTQRGGPWGVPELGALTHLHRDFSHARNITEITLRYSYLQLLLKIQYHHHLL